LNRIKRGVADLELDCDKAITAIQCLSEEKILERCSTVDMKFIAYSIVFYCQHEEYSVREYATHFLEYVLKQSKKQLEKSEEDEHIVSLYQLIEQ